jgi:hypothetical protein
MAMEAADLLAKEGIGVDLLAVATVKPIDEAALAASAKKTGAVLAVEEHNIVGGFGAAVAEALAKRAPARMEFIGVQDRFTESGPYDALMKKYGITVEAIVAKAKGLVAAKRAEAKAAAPAAKGVAKKKPAVKAKAVKKAATKKPAVKAKAVKKATPKKAAPKKASAKKPVKKTAAKRR